ncbi:MAG: glutamate 5-kinase [Cyanobacteria bacterium]|nr:glutamate 5-kinase [Cyanobacteriota bacterium]MDA1020192.1 glutamate 5-kinase [Cyanobacteriota bacterium]
MSKIIILKIGTNSITREKPACAVNLQGKPIVNVGINYQVLNELAQTADDLRKQGFEVIIVSSGAMGLGVAKLGPETLKEKLEQICESPDLVSFKQALTAVGQVDLMNAYTTVFSNYHAFVGQVLVTHKGLDDTERNETLAATIRRMLLLDIIPIVNANDAVSASELEYGDNDSLAARVAVLSKASRLVVISDADGLYDNDPKLDPNAKLIKEVTKIEDVKAFAHESSSTAGLGGMKSKVAAAAICVDNGIAVDIVGVASLSKIAAYISGADQEIPGTHFYAA